MVEQSDACLCEDYIPFTVGTVVRIKGYGALNNYNTVFYKSDKVVFAAGGASSVPQYCTYSYDGTNGIVTLTAINENIAYIRVAGVLIGTTKDVIITVNEEITNNPTTPDTPSYTNLLPLSVDANGNDYKGTNGEDGYKSGYKMSTSSGGESAQDKAYCSGFMPITDIYSTIYIKNITLHSSINVNNFVFYNSSKTKIGSVTANGTMGGFHTSVKVNGGVYSCQPKNFMTANEGADIAFFRFSCGGISDETLVTVDKEITELYTNQLPLAKNADGTLFVGTNGEKGYKYGYRIKGSTGVEEALENEYCTGFMEAGADGYRAKIRIKNITLNDTVSYNQLVYYDENYTRVYAVANQSWTDNGDGTYSFRPSDVTSSINAVYFRLCCAEISDETIITVNEDIV